MAERTPRVCMMVDTQVYGDARVVKTARTVRELGYSVTVVGIRPPSNQRAPELDPDVQLEALRDRLDSEIFLEKLESRVIPSTRPVAARYPLAYRKGGRVRAVESSLAAVRRNMEVDLVLGQSAWSPSFLGRRVRFAASRHLHDIRKSGRRDAQVHRQKEARQWLSQLGAVDEPSQNGQRSWLMHYPRFQDFEDAVAPRLDASRPDIIHAHDALALGVAVRFALRARAHGRNVKVIYDAHEFVQGQGDSQIGRAVVEGNYLRFADHVVTVSEPLAEQLMSTYGLAVKPDVTLNAPEASAIGGEGSSERDVRRDCGLGHDTPLMVYSGGIARQRGVDTAVRGLTELPGVHLAVVGSPDPKSRARLGSLARRLGVDRQLHILSYVPQDSIIQHLRSADIAVHPMVHLPNHEIAMPNKFFDYIHAGLPMVVSDVKHLAATVEDNRFGMSFRAEDPSDFARAVVAVLDNKDEYRATIASSPLLDEFTWEAQQDSLEAVYRGLSE